MGKMVVQKSVEASAEGFIQFSLGEEVQLHPVVNYSGQPGKASISRNALLTEWPAYHGHRPTLRTLEHALRLCGTRIIFFFPATTRSDRDFHFCR